MECANQLGPPPELVGVARLAGNQVADCLHSGKALRVKASLDQLGVIRLREMLGK